MPIVESAKGIPCACAARTPAISPLGVHQSGEAGRCDSERKLADATADGGGGTGDGDVTQDARLEFGVLKGAARTPDSDLLLRSSVDVVEHHLRHASASDRHQIRYGACSFECGLRSARVRSVEREERLHTRPAGELSRRHHDESPSSRGNRPAMRGPIAVRFLEPSPVQLTWRRADVAPSGRQSRR